eukprot:4796241-Prymnesium_polylepis.1
MATAAATQATPHVRFPSRKANQKYFRASGADKMNEALGCAAAHKPGGQISKTIHARVHTSVQQRHGLKPGRSASRASRHEVTESERPLLEAARSHDALRLTRETRDGRQLLHATPLSRAWRHADSN